MLHIKPYEMTVTVILITNLKIKISLQKFEFSKNKYIINTYKYLQQQEKKHIEIIIIP